MKNHTYLALACIFLLTISIGGCDLATPVVYEIRFHSNDGSDTVIMQSALAEAAIVLQTNSFTREGYTFAGWMATEPDGTPLDFTDGQEIFMGSTHIDLYANWESAVDSGLLQSLGYQFPGSAGGLVFYDKRYYSDGWRYLEMAPASTEWTAEWGALGYLVMGANRVSLKFPPWAQETSVYGGALNTQQIVQYHNNLGTIYPDRGDYYSNPDKYPTGLSI
ncbi:MAG: InlB B-repeat-containing protein, partial [Rectinemataceae bacterium]|nr:InlB B-repeat-containing protein [Rectinemataceae bacterium]